MEYWYRNLRQPVRFRDTVRTLLADGYRAFIEVSPHPVLIAGTQDTADETLGDLEDAVIGGSLRRNQGGLDRFLASLAEMHVRGVDVDWAALRAGSAVTRVTLPTYPFQRSRHWLDAPNVGSRSAGAADRTGMAEDTGTAERTGTDEDTGTAEHTATTESPESVPASSIAARLAGLTVPEQRRIVLGLVRAHVAIVLGYDSAEAVPMKRAFKELGFDLAAATQLRNRLTAATGLKLPTEPQTTFPIAPSSQSSCCAWRAVHRWSLPQRRFCLRFTTIRLRSWVSAAAIRAG